jgi:hypothetical protein
MAAKMAAAQVAGDTSPPVLSHVFCFAAHIFAARFKPAAKAASRSLTNCSILSAACAMYWPL